MREISATDDDATLIRRIAAASPPGAARSDEAELCRRYARAIRLYGRRHLRDDDAASDLVQHVLLIVLQSVRSGAVKEPERFGSFVLGTCRLVVRDQLRTEDRRRALLEEYGADLVPCVPEEERAPLVRARLDECFGRLSERDRSVLVLSYYVERTPEELAEDLGTTQGNVRLVRHRALARLADCVTVGRGDA